ncbi:hypothetical protein NVS89_09230 [Ancylobacter sp. MQZ15Z-1]|uniref:Uncharacterized protein n=1 Tax=Ancylobacter mangrovi TaxID=2972472 RepID=A0A9X2PC87_9HYPH|nr:hypothetical protein [Ancylobacter mangrovi]MCS0495280.1 hypothetical protein [Ancylobacter mangrovi]
MAWIKSIARADAKGKLQPTEVVAVVKVFDTANATSIVQIDTHGSDDRENPGKQSQTIQFGEEAAKQLFEIFRETYGFK